MKLLTAMASALIVCAPWVSAAPSAGSSPNDFAYRMDVVGTGDAAAYRVSLPLAVYQKVTHADLADLRVFNGNGEQVPFAIERPAAGTVADAATALALFPLKDDSGAALEAIKVTIESGKGSINVQAGGQKPPADRVNTYIVDGRSLKVPIAALRLEWPQDAADFAGRVRVEASDSLGDWRVVASSAPVANLHSNAERLVEQRVEFHPTQAKYWRLSWSGTAAPFMLTSLFGEPAKQSVDAQHASLKIAAIATKRAQGEFEYDLGGSLPVDRVNLELPDINTVVDVELLSRELPASPWHTVRRSGFYRLNGNGEELRNGPVSVMLNTDRHWLVRTDPKRGGLGNTAPGLVVEWVPHEVVFVARGKGPFYIAYGNATAEPAAVSLAMLPKNVAIAPASLSDARLLGGASRLQPPATAYPWKTALLWAILVLGAGLLAFMAYRLSKDLSR
jgi:hypothetical protein